MYVCTYKFAHEKAFGMSIFGHEILVLIDMRKSAIYKIVGVLAERVCIVGVYMCEDVLTCHNLIHQTGVKKMASVSDIFTF